MRTIKLTHEEIETIKTALQYVYDRKIDMVYQNRKTLGEEASSKILEQANKYLIHKMCLMAIVMFNL